MTLSALSMQMKGLETEFHVELFDRSVRPPRLTPMGRAFADKAKEILYREDDLLELCSLENELIGQFKIGLVTSASARLLPKFLINSRRNLEQASFEFETGLSETLQGKVLSGNIDAAVITDTEVSSKALSYTVLREEAFAFVAHASIADGGLPSLLAEQTFFHFMPQTGIGKVIAGAMENIERPMNARTVILDNLEAIMGCVKNGLGYTLLPVPDIDRYGTSDLVKLPAPNDLRRSLVLIARANNMLVKRFDILAAQFTTDSSPL